MSSLPSSWSEGPTLRRRDRTGEELVAPVEVAASAPEAFLRFRAGGFLRSLLAGPGEHGGIGSDSRLLAVHGLFEACLLFGFEKGVIVERIRGLVVTDRHRLLEPGVPLLQLEMVLNDLGEDRRRLNLHRGSWVGGWGSPYGRDCSPSERLSQPKLVKVSAGERTRLLSRPGSCRPAWPGTGPHRPQQRAPKPSWPGESLRRRSSQSRESGCRQRPGRS